MWRVAPVAMLEMSGGGMVSRRSALQTIPLALTTTTAGSSRNSPDTGPGASGPRPVLEGGGGAITEDEVEEGGGGEGRLRALLLRQLNGNGEDITWPAFAGSPPLQGTCRYSTAFPTPTAWGPRNPLTPATQGGETEGRGTAATAANAAAATAATAAAATAAALAGSTIDYGSSGSGVTSPPSPPPSDSPLFGYPLVTQRLRGQVPSPAGGGGDAAAAAAAAAAALRFPGWMTGTWLVEAQFKGASFPQGRGELNLRVAGAGLATCLALPNVGLSPPRYAQRFLPLAGGGGGGGGSGVPEASYGDVAFNLPRTLEAFWPQAKATYVQNYGGPGAAAGEAAKPKKAAAAAAEGPEAAEARPCFSNGWGCGVAENPTLHAGPSLRASLGFAGPTRSGGGYRAQTIDLSVVAAASAGLRPTATTATTATTTTATTATTTTAATATATTTTTTTTTTAAATTATTATTAPGTAPGTATGVGAGGRVPPPPPPPPSSYVSSTTFVQYNVEQDLQTAYTTLLELNPPTTTGGGGSRHRVVGGRMRVAAFKQGEGTPPGGPGTGPGGPGAPSSSVAPSPSSSSSSSASSRRPESSQAVALYDYALRYVETTGPADGDEEE